jgi:DNA topoisomerase I
MNLFVVESKGKIAKISKILGKGYVVKASYGHVRDLDKNSMSIDFDNDFAPIYVVTKPEIVSDLKRSMKGVDCLYIASDLDMEGEAIGQHLYDILKPKKYKRVVFNSITKETILTAIKQAGVLDKNLVDAQRARRILDRLFGYMISPVLGRNLGGKLSAGRVQSVATKIIVDKEKEIEAFVNVNESSSSFRVTAQFENKLSSVLHLAKNNKLPYTSSVAALSKPDKNVVRLLGKMSKSTFKVVSVKNAESIRKPSPPFETSTLQQEAHRKFGMSVKTTMTTAQMLYDGGFITYMRTDSITISEEGHAGIKKVIVEKYGAKDYNYTQYATKSASAQEAHEAIRPTDPSIMSVAKEIDNALAIKLYKLIWQRTIASQMKPAKIDVCTIQISISKIKEDVPHYFFQSQIENIIYPGFMKVYVESKDEPADGSNSSGVTTDFKGRVPKEGSKIAMLEITAKEEFARAPPRYTEASMIKTLKKLGIGRPSTYANTITTIIKQEYVQISDVPGVKKVIAKYTVGPTDPDDKVQIEKEDIEINVGKENKKLIPTKLGIRVTEYLVENFPDMMDYQFTAKLETELDKIAEGSAKWNKVVKKYYDKLEPIVTKLKSQTIEKVERYVGKIDGFKVYATKTKYGPVVKKMIEGVKPLMASIPSPLTEKTVTLKDAIKLFEYPKILGDHDGQSVLLKKGKFGLYIAHGGKNYQMKEQKEITLKEATALIKTSTDNTLGSFTIGPNAVTILNGQYGPYLRVVNSKRKWNCPLPKDINVKKLTKSQIETVMKNRSQRMAQPKTKK